MPIAALARKINAQAVEQEIKNSVEYVDAYFEGGAINKEARAKENPNHLAREDHLYEVRKKMVEKHLDQGSKVDVLNWLLAELSVPVLSNQYMVGRGALTELPLNQKLAADDLNQLMLTSGGGGGSRPARGKPWRYTGRWRSRPGQRRDHRGARASSRPAPTFSTTSARTAR